MHEPLGIDYFLPLSAHAPVVGVIEKAKGQSIRLSQLGCDLNI